jgi:hypothetical protein
MNGLAFALGLIVAILFFGLLHWLYLQVNKPIPTMERGLLNKLMSDDTYRSNFLQNPKQALEQEVSSYLGTQWQLAEQVQVQTVLMDPNVLYVLVPPEQLGVTDWTKLSSCTRTGTSTPLEQIVKATHPSVFYGAFMGLYQNKWIRMGLLSGSSIQDVTKELNKAVCVY